MSTEDPKTHEDVAELFKEFYGVELNSEQKLQLAITKLIWIALDDGMKMGSVLGILEIQKRIIFQTFENKIPHMEDAQAEIKLRAGKDRDVA